jgi:hypothetical protein
MLASGGSPGYSRLLTKAATGSGAGSSSRYNQHLRGGATHPLSVLRLLLGYDQTHLKVGLTGKF